MIDYQAVMNHLDEREIARASAAKQMVMAYPYYTDEQRAAWIDSIDGMLETRKQMYQAAHQALEKAFNGHKTNP